MIKYIIFTGNITNMGGAQQYLSNKVKRLRHAGIEPIILSTRRGDVILNNLKAFLNYRVTILRFRPICYKSKDVSKIIDELINMVGSADKYYIESNGIAFVEWAELLAEKLNGKHVCINLQEVHNYDKYQLRYLRFKYDRNELYGISDASTSLMLRDTSIDPDRKHAIAAECNNVVEDVETDILNQLKAANYTIGCIGRLEKNYVRKGADEVLIFAKKHTDSIINLIFIGGGKKEDADYIRSTFDCVKNVNLIITGFLSPIPKVLLQRIDCFFAGAGSSRVSMMEGRPTISMAADTGCAIGILNYTTTNTLYAENGDIQRLSDLLEAVLIDSYCVNHLMLGMENEKYDFENEFNRQLSFFESNDSNYFQFTDFHPVSYKDKLYSFLGHVLGPKSLDFLQRSFSRIVHSI